MRHAGILLSYPCLVPSVIPANAGIQVFAGRGVNSGWYPCLQSYLFCSSQRKSREIRTGSTGTGTTPACQKIGCFDLFFLLLLLGMIITHFGNASYRIQNGETSMLIDPENNRLKADITLKTLVSTSNPFEPLPDSTLISLPGEYETRGIEIIGFPLLSESTEKFIKIAYVVTWEDIKMVIMGHASQPPDATLMEEFAEPDVLILPAAGGHFLEPAVAAKMVRQLEASVAIPSFTTDAEDFLKALGKKAEPTEKFVFKKKDLIGEKGRPVVLVSAG